MNYDNLDTPVYICEEKLLEKNLKLLDYVQKQSVLYAVKMLILADKDIFF